MRVNAQQQSGREQGRGHGSTVSPARLQTALLPLRGRDRHHRCRGRLSYRRLPVNPTTVALTFLLVVLGVASRWGLTIATTTAVVATLAFNYFFLPPVAHLHHRRSAELDRAAGLSDQRHCRQPPFRACPPRSR